ncbi:hypothetical protein MBLNU459_g1657t2 [Dothideomycetes sp. NU459]
MSNTEPRMIYWGEDKLMLYNEAASVVIGSPHPRQALGNPFADVWGEDILDRQMTMISRAILDDQATQAADFEAVLDRRGFAEETYWRLKFLPIVGSDGYTVGALNEYTESTYSIYDEQRRKLVSRLGESLSAAETLPEVWSLVLNQLKDQLFDVSFALLYSKDAPDDTSSSSSAPSPQKAYRLAGCIGVEESVFEPTISLDQDVDRHHFLPEFKRAQDTRQIVVLGSATRLLPSNLAIPIPDRGTVRQVCILPIASHTGQELGVIVLGMNPRRAFGEESRLFLENLRDTVVKAAVLVSLPDEQRRQRRFEEMNLALAQQLRITALKAEKNEETFIRMAQNAPFGMYMYTAGGDPLYVNDAYLELIGLSREALANEAESGLAWRNTIFEEDIEFIEKSWQGLTVAKTPTKLEYRVKAPPKRRGDPVEPRWLEAISFPELDEENRVVTVQDGIFTSLETPAEGESLNLSSDTANHIIDSAQTVMLCAQHQKTIIDDILTISKLDSDLLVIAPDRVKAPEIIGRAMKMYEAELARNDIQASVEVDQSYTDLAIEWVMLDPSRLLQVIINLLTNAIKFTRDSETRRITAYLSASKTPPTGTRHHLEYSKQRRDATKSNPLSTSPEWGPGEEIYLEFAVQDTGKGLTEDEMKLLFQRFAQASPKTYTQYGGSGLGLFISKELTELQGGQIGVIGEAGAGCTFAFYIKARRCPDPPRSQSQSRRASLSKTESETRISSQSNGTGKSLSSRNGSITNGTKSFLSELHILIVEDNKINQKVMSAQLKRLGCTVHTVDHGLDALTFLSTTSFYRSGEHPLSLILMDLEMPVMDGLTCVRRIRQLQRTKEIISHVPVIAITANARSEQINTALKAGMDDVVTKPFRIPDLVPRMQALVSRDACHEIM